MKEEKEYCEGQVEFESFEEALAKGYIITRSKIVSDGFNFGIQRGGIYYIKKELTDKEIMDHIKEKL